MKNSIYELPLMLHREKFDSLVCDALGLKTPEPDLTKWKAFVDRIVNPTNKTKIAVVGKYIELQDAYKSVYEALTHAGASNDCEVSLVRVDAEDLEHEKPGGSSGRGAGDSDSGGFGDRGVEGKIIAARYALGEWNSLPWPVPWDANRDHRIRPATSVDFRVRTARNSPMPRPIR